MAKNLTSRVSLVTLSLRGQPSERFTFTTKEALEQFLFGVAVDSWSASNGPMPTTRKGTLEAFFCPKAGNSYRCERVTQISNTAAARIGATASAAMTRQRQTSRSPQTAGRSR
jgi:hypothetical protein